MQDLPPLPDRIRDSFAQQSLMKTFDARILEVSPGRVQLSAPILPLALQHHGVGHAGLTFALGDTAAGYAALTQMPPDHEVVTSEMKINLLAPATGAHLVATGQVVKPGRRLFVVTCEVTRDDGELVALLQGTMVPVANRAA